jgi:hypothetical protein
MSEDFEWLKKYFLYKILIFEHMAFLKIKELIMKIQTRFSKAGYQARRTWRAG